MNPIVAEINKRYMRKTIPDIVTGDIVRVAQKITEGAKTRTQIFEGVVIERSGGSGMSAAITVRRIASGVGVEKKYLLNSPMIEGVEVVRSSRVRRKKIYFFRELTGKSMKLREKKREVLQWMGDVEDTKEEDVEEVTDGAKDAEASTIETPAEDSTPEETEKASEQDSSNDNDGQPEDVKEEIKEVDEDKSTTEEPGEKSE